MRPHRPIDGSPSGSAVPRILQARTLEWVVISLSNAWKWKMKVKSLSHVRFFATPWTAAYQAPPSMGFSRQEYWSGVPLPSLILNITLLACEMSTTEMSTNEHSLALPFFGIGMKTDLFQSFGHCWVFRIYWHIECSNLKALSFRNWSSSTGFHHLL